MTGDATPDLERRLLEIGASTLLRKPFETDDFLSTIRTLRPKNLETLYRETAPRLRAMMARRFGLRSDQTQDVLHQAWCTFLQNRRFVLNAGAWLTGTVINLCKQTLERAARVVPGDTAPSSAMTPTGSCPITSPGRTGYSPLTICRSVPQIVVVVTRISASPGPA